MHPEQIGVLGERWERPGEGQREVVLVGWLLLVAERHDRIFEAEQDARLDVEGEVEIDWAATAFFWVEIDLPDLPQGVGLHEVPLVVHVEAMVDRVVLEIGHVAGHVYRCHSATIAAGCAHLGWYGTQMEPDAIHQVLLAAGAAVRDALDGFSERGFSGLRPTQYKLDVVADAAAVEVLTSAGLGVISEESGTTHGDRPLVCVLDPIDGSTNCDHGVPFFSTSMCVLDTAGPLVGVVVNQATGVTYAATRGGGATRDGEPISTSGQTSLASSIIAFSGLPPRHLGWAQFRAFGAASLEFCLVADGSIDGFSQVGGSSINPWDYLAGLLIATESGAACRDLRGEDLYDRVAGPRRPVVAATAQLLDDLVTVVMMTA